MGPGLIGINVPSAFLYLENLCFDIYVELARKLLTGLLSLGSKSTNPHLTYEPNHVKVKYLRDLKNSLFPPLLCVVEILFCENE